MGFIGFKFDVSKLMKLSLEILFCMILSGNVAYLCTKYGYILVIYTYIHTIKYILTHYFAMILSISVTEIEVLL